MHKNNYFIFKHFNLNVDDLEIIDACIKCVFYFNNISAIKYVGPNMHNWLDLWSKYGVIMM